MTAIARRTTTEQPLRRHRRLFSAQPDDIGLYRGENEHDACGVAMVATMRGSAGHDIIEHALTALRNLDHRGATGADPLGRRRRRHPQPGPRRVPARGRRLHRCPAPARMPSASPSCPWTSRSAPRRSRRSSGSPPRSPSRSSAGATCRSPPTSSARSPATACRTSPSCSSPVEMVRAVDRPSGVGLDRFAFCLRKRAELETDVYFASLSSRTLVYKGMLTTAQLEPFFPDLSHRSFAVRARPGPLALLDQHVPVVAALAPLPVHRPQRRDQHRQGQPQLDERPREPARPPTSSPATSSGSSRSAPRGASDSASFDEVLELLHLGGRSPAARRADDDPRGVGEPHRDGPGPPGVLRVPLDVHGAVGRPGLRRVHRRHAHRRGPRPQRPAAGPVCGHRRRAGRARLRVRRPRPRPGQGRQARPAPAGPDVPRRHRARPDHRRRGDQVLARVAAPLRRVAARRPARAGATCPSASTSCTRRRRSRGASRPSATPRRSCASCSPRWPRAAARRSARWAPTARSRCCPAGRGCCSTTSPSCSPR